MKTVNIDDLPLGRYRVKYGGEWMEAELIRLNGIKVPVFRTEEDGDLDYELLDSREVVPI